MIEPAWLPQLGLGLRLWPAVYLGGQATWLRWCDLQGNFIPTGRERADAKKQRADVEKQRADNATERAARLAAKLRELGLDPDTV